MTVEIITSRHLVELIKKDLCRVANEFWSECDEGAKSFLLGHGHHFVQSTAKCSANGHTAQHVAKLHGLEHVRDDDFFNQIMMAVKNGDIDSAVSPESIAAGCVPQNFG